MDIKKFFNSLFRKKDGRKAVETVSVTKEKGQKENKFMEEEKKTVVEEKEVKPAAPVEEQKDEVKPTEAQEVKPVEGEEASPAEEPVVDNTPPTGNGIALEDVATKDFVKKMFASFEAKYEALLKENEDLKAKLSEKDSKVAEMQDKYENKDFGGFSKKGVPAKDKDANDTFDNYSKQFM